MLGPELTANIRRTASIAEGLKAERGAGPGRRRGLNAFEELADYYVPGITRSIKWRMPHLVSPGTVALRGTGGYTRDHRIVMAHLLVVYLWGALPRDLIFIPAWQSLVMVFSRRHHQRR